MAINFVFEYSFIQILKYQMRTMLIKEGWEKHVSRLLTTFYLDVAQLLVHWEVLQVHWTGECGAYPMRLTRLDTLHNEDMWGNFCTFDFSALRHRVAPSESCLTLSCRDWPISSHWQRTARKKCKKPFRESSTSTYSVRYPHARLVCSWQDDLVETSCFAVKRQAWVSPELAEVKVNGEFLKCGVWQSRRSDIPFKKTHHVFLWDTWDGQNVEVDADIHSLACWE